jgi:hypothetical protein
MMVITNGMYTCTALEAAGKFGAGAGTLVLCEGARVCSKKYQKSENDFRKKYQNSKNDCSRKYQNSKNDVSGKIKPVRTISIRNIKAVK